MKQNDAYYLQNDVIAEIFKSSDAVLHSRVFGSIERTYKEGFFKRVVFRQHYLIPAPVLEAVAEDAFNEMNEVFFFRVRNNEFDAKQETLVSYLLTTFKHRYLNLYRKELTQRKHQAHKKKTTEIATTMNPDWPAYNLPGSIYTILAAIVNRLKPGCKTLMTLLYLKNETEESVLKQTEYKNIHSLRQGASRCRDEVRGLLSRDFGID